MNLEDMTRFGIGRLTVSAGDSTTLSFGPSTNKIHIGVRYQRDVQRSIAKSKYCAR